MAATASRKKKRDESIMNTNNSCIVSKRSVEKLYHGEDNGFLRHFVKKFQRRSPLINRGYWLRMTAIERTVLSFLRRPARKKAIVNLGCGYDPLPLKLLSQHAQDCEGAMFIDVDYPDLMRKKCEVIRATPQLFDVLSEPLEDAPDDVLIFQSKQFNAVACDLHDMERLEQALRRIINKETECDVLFIAEVSITYMDVEPADKIISWAASYGNSYFCLLEQFLPDGPEHPFAETMIKHFAKLGSPLKPPLVYTTIGDLKTRFLDCGWSAPSIRSLWSIWGDDTFVDRAERQRLNSIEPFDEWEEFALFASHYFLLLASSTSEPNWPVPTIGSPPPRRSTPPEPRDVQPSALHLQMDFQQVDGEPRHHGAMVNLENNGVAQILHHGGQGQRGRLEGSDVYLQIGRETHSSDTPRPTVPRKLGITCHTVTRLSSPDSYLVVGGRTSPGTAFPYCFREHKSTWEKVADLPDGRYRHCAVPVAAISSKVKDVEMSSGVLIYGGKTSSGEVLGDFLYWEPDGQWCTVEVVQGSTLPQRFGASMTLKSPGRCGGYVTGGIGVDGLILDDFWEWELTLDQKPTVRLTDRTHHLQSQTTSSMGRFGATLSTTSWGHILVGGVGRDMLLQDDEILAFSPELQVFSLKLSVNGPRPLLIGVGIASICDDSSLFLVGGGAVCFSFGTYWNQGCRTLQLADDEVVRWSLVTLEQSLAGQSSESNGEAPKLLTSLRTVPRRAIDLARDFEAIVMDSRAVVAKMDFGPCGDLWDDDYLKDKVGGDRTVVVHDSKTSTMSFLSKNFSYARMSFGDFLDALRQGKKLYLRAIAEDRPTERTANFWEDFASIAEDFQLPPELSVVTSNVHSSVLRISGPVAMWLHYDVMANVYCQVQGQKRMLLFPPTDVDKLAFPPGTSSSNLAVFKDDGQIRTPQGTHPQEVLLSPGDLLFIPPLWPHTSSSTGSRSVAVNVFFRSLAGGYAAGKDVYGNRDVQAYENARKDIARMAKAFDSLPPEMASFYLARLAAELREAAEARLDGAGSR